MAACIPCRDVVQNWVGVQVSKKLSGYHLGDALMLANGLLLVVVGLQGYIAKNVALAVFVIGAMIFIFRFLLVVVTRCQIDNHSENPSWFEPGDGWYMVSGHTVVSILVTFLIIRSGTHRIIKGLSVLSALLTMLFQIMLFEHKTCDILIGAAITFLALKAFPPPG
jgi:hypothetical protein